MKTILNDFAAQYPDAKHIYVYLCRIECDPPVFKIGITHDPSKRAKTLRWRKRFYSDKVTVVASVPVAIDIAPEVEQDVLKRFRMYRMPDTQEWFSEVPDFAANVASVIGRYMSLGESDDE